LDYLVDEGGFWSVKFTNVCQAWRLFIHTAVSNRIKEAKSNDQIIIQLLTRCIVDSLIQSRSFTDLYMTPPNQEGEQTNKDFLQLSLCQSTYEVTASLHMKEIMKEAVVFDPMFWTTSGWTIFYPGEFKVSASRNAYLIEDFIFNLVKNLLSNKENKLSFNKIGQWTMDERLFYQLLMGLLPPEDLHCYSQCHKVAVTVQTLFDNARKTNFIGESLVKK
jgi:hypothetical protein